MAVVYVVPQSQFLKQSDSTFGIPGQIILLSFHYEYHNLMGNFIEIIIIRSDNNNGDDVGNGNNFSCTGGRVSSDYHRCIGDGQRSRTTGEVERAGYYLLGPSRPGHV